MVSGQPHVLLVNGSSNKTSAPLREILDEDSYRIDAVNACQDALSLLERAACDVVLLDLEVQGLAGVEIMKQIREMRPETSIILVTRHPTTASAIEAIRHGAHDYLIKPINSQDLKRSVAEGLEKARRTRMERQLIARLRDIIHLVDGGTDGILNGSLLSPAWSAGERHDDGYLQIRDIVIDSQRRVVRQNGKSVSLTPTEFDLLTYLMQNADEVQSYRTLVKEVLGYEADEWEARNLIKFHIHCLRKKVEPNPKEPTYIVNVRGVGYLFASRDV